VSSVHGYGQNKYKTALCLTDTIGFLCVKHSKTGHVKFISVVLMQLYVATLFAGITMCSRLGN